MLTGKKVENNKKKKWPPVSILLPFPDSLVGKEEEEKKRFLQPWLNLIPHIVLEFTWPCKKVRLWLTCQTLKSKFLPPTWRKNLDVCVRWDARWPKPGLHAMRKIALRAKRVCVQNSILVVRWETQRTRFLRRVQSLLSIKRKYRTWLIPVRYM